MSEALTLFPVQFEPIWENPSASLHKLESLLATTPPPLNALILLPEMFATGFSMPAVDQAATQAPAIKAALTSIARNYSCHIVAGMAVENRQNQAIVFDHTGSIIARYAKQRLFTPALENNHVEAGDRPGLFRWHNLACALFVCYDLRFPELFREATCLGAECFIIIANWPEQRQSDFNILIQARALENQAFAIGVNRSGRDSNFTYAGKSLIVSPWGKILWQALDKSTAEAVTINPDEPREARKNFPTLRDSGINPKSHQDTPSASCCEIPVDFSP